jgi:hypothetical protein
MLLFPRLFAFTTAALSAVGLFVACSSSTSNGPADATCPSPGKPTAGAADMHCQGQAPQPVSEASCHVTDAGATGGGDGGTPPDTCDYGATMFGTEGDDDDCKYHVVWSSTPLCEGAAGVQFTVKITSLVNNAPVTGIPMGVVPEVFIPTDPNAACDDMSTHPSPSAPNLVETPANSGTYVGNVVFDAAGQWTIRFHIHEECAR